MLIAALSALLLVWSTASLAEPKRLCYCERDGARKQCHYEVPPPPRRLCWDET